VALLESELEKVFCFQKEKSDEIVCRIKASEQDVTEVLTRLDSSSSSDQSTDADFLLLEGMLSDIIADVHDLAKYTQLNYTGFQKIIKKHDVGPRLPFPLPSKLWFRSGADFHLLPCL
jgi:SPX domain protein involved in polyphosphate accumulation